MNNLREQFAVLERLGDIDEYWQKRCKELDVDVVKKLYGKQETGHAVQNVHTPYKLCKEIVDKLLEVLREKKEDLSDKIAATLNVEFLPYLFSAKELWFFCDSTKKELFVRLFYPQVKILRGSFLALESDMKWDCVIGNPPYQAPIEVNNKRRGGLSLWDKFMPMSLTLVKDNGFVCLVHPCRWRKPEDKLFQLFRDNNLMYLEIHNAKDGLRVFGAGTRYDWYVLQKSSYKGSTEVMGEDGVKKTIDIKNFTFLPNCEFDLLKSVIALPREETVKVILDYAYGTDYEDKKPWLSRERTNTHIYPLVHATNKDGNRFYWTDTKSRGHFGISKVIFGETGVNCPILDDKGEYGMTQQAMALVISSKKEGDNIVKAIISDKFQKLLVACSWSNFRIDWRMFKYFRRDFWKEFV